MGTGGRGALERGGTIKRGWKAEIPRSRDLEKLRLILGQREWNHYRKGAESESKRYWKWEVQTP